MILLVINFFESQKIDKQYNVNKYINITYKMIRELSKCNPKNARPMPETPENNYSKSFILGVLGLAIFLIWLAYYVS